MPLAREEMERFDDQLREVEDWLKSLEHPTPDITKLLGHKTLRDIRFTFSHLLSGGTHSARIASDVLAKAKSLPFYLGDAINCMFLAFPICSLSKYGCGFLDGTP
jgi:hypothetical protein